MNDRALPENLKTAIRKYNTTVAMELMVGLLAWGTGLFMGMTWLLGFVFAKGFFSTLCCLLPFYAWYLDLEKLAQYLHWI